MVELWTANQGHQSLNPKTRSALCISLELGLGFRFCFLHLFISLDSVPREAVSYLNGCWIWSEYERYNRELICQATSFLIIETLLLWLWYLSPGYSYLTLAKLKGYFHLLKVFWPMCWHRTNFRMSGSLPTICRTRIRTHDLLAMCQPCLLLDHHWLGLNYCHNHIKHARSCQSMRLSSKGLGQSCYR